MAAERTPSRRKQCIFRRTLQRFPFGRCERKSSSSSSYDIHNGDKSPYTPTKWSPTDPSTSPFSSHQPVHGESLDSGVSGRTQLPSVEPPNSFNGRCEDSMALEAMTGINHVSNLGFFPPHHLPQHHMNTLLVSLDTTGQQDADSAYTSVSIPEYGTQLPVESPPSPSSSSMEMDVGVDPETGERAMD